MKRERIEAPIHEDASQQPRERANGGSYFTGPKQDIAFISSGSTLLDLALGGGWCEGRICNVIGDKSAGKTLHAIEACTNFALKHPKGLIKYRECESAFDPEYARALGMPVSRIDFGTGLETVEDLFEDLQAVVKTIKKRPCLYIVDSLDALSDRGEMERDMDEGTYGTAKAKLLSQLFRRLTQQMAGAQLTLMIISQIRSRIGVSFGETTTRSGGRALDFYSSQNIKLAQVGTINRSIFGQKRLSGIKVRAKVTKNKVSIPFREVEFPILFGYGIDDVTSCLEWMKEIGALKDFGLAVNDIKSYAKDLIEAPRARYDKEMQDIREIVADRWYEMEQKLLPKRSKYGGE